jgi:hypothetical protein
MPPAFPNGDSSPVDIAFALSCDNLGGGGDGRAAGGEGGECIGELIAFSSVGGNVWIGGGTVGIYYRKWGGDRQDRFRSDEGGKKNLFMRPSI